MASLLPLTLTPATTMPRGRRNADIITTRKKNAVRALGQEVSDALPTLPYTTSEWTLAVADVKREYLNRRYRPCVARCTDILDNVCESDVVEPAYLVYLHFYAASASEMQARGLSEVSGFRLDLFRQAREHYVRASELIRTAQMTARRPSAESPISCPGLHSPTSSVSSQASTISQASTVSTAATTIVPASPRQSALKNPAKASRIKKRVTWSDTATDPMVRPDSPTLGSVVGDWSGRFSPDLIDAMPLPPSISTKHLSVPFPSRTAQIHLEPAADPFVRARSIHRYCSILESLQRQITIHMSFIEEEFARAPTPPPGPLDAEIRALDVHSRIERLRASGWQRKRFDVERYQALRRSALADLA